MTPMLWLLSLGSLCWFPTLPDPEPDPFAKGFLGVQLTDQGLVMVTSVLPNTPAAKAGLREGDVIIKIDGVPATNLQTTIQNISARRAGSLMVVDVQRGAKKFQIKVKVAARPPDLVQPQLPEIDLPVVPDR